MSVRGRFTLLYEKAAALEWHKITNSHAVLAAKHTTGEEQGHIMVADVQGLTQWSTKDNKTFFPTGTTISKLAPGAYEIKVQDHVGLYFERIAVKVEDLVRFPNTNSEKVIAEILKFWEREELFKEFGLMYKRGICLYGPPGGGKSSTIRLIMKDVIDRGGVVLKFTHPTLFINALRSLQEIQPETPIIVLMEDIDSILRAYCESEVLNMLDGVEEIQRVVFLSTTNYPDQLGDRIINRPSRFDKRFYIGNLDDEGRYIFFRHLLKGKNCSLTGIELSKHINSKAERLGVNLDRWVEETDDLSIAHLQELFVAVVIQGDDFKEAIDTLKSMYTQVRGDRDPASGGFGFPGKVEKTCYVTKS